MITGGARGVTAQVARALAERYRPHLVLLGRSALPTVAEAPDITQLDDPRAIKAALIERRRTSSTPLVPTEIEEELSRVLADRDIRATLADLESHASSVDYITVDVRDDDAFTRTIRDIYRVNGRIDGVIHGAGVIEDKLVVDKEPESFRRVFETKVRSALTIAREVRPDARLVAFFSSVAGQFGNRGQADYAAANRVLDQLARMLNTRSSGRVVSLIWNPWSSGMASVEVQARFRAQGVQLVDPESGRRAFIEELERGRDDQPAVMLGDGPWADDASRITEQTRGSAGFVQIESRDLPLIAPQGVVSSAGGSVTLSWPLRLDVDRWLEDHKLDGTAVLPAAMAVELMAETAIGAGLANGDIEVEDVRVLKGIRVEGVDRALRVSASPRGMVEVGEPAPGAVVELQDERTGIVHYRATVRPARPGAQTELDGPSVPDLDAYPLSAREAYDTLLFHGPRFQAIVSVDGIGPGGISARLNPSVPTSFRPESSASSWVIDPILLDGGFQLAILWMRHAHDMTPLPSGLRRLWWSSTGTAGLVRCELSARASVGGHLLDTDLRYLDETGRTIGWVAGMSFSCSSELNRLAATPRKVVLTEEGGHERSPNRRRHRRHGLHLSEGPEPRGVLGEHPWQGRRNRRSPAGLGRGTDPGPGIQRERSCLHRPRRLPRRPCEFDPTRYCVMPRSVDGTEPEHYLALRVAHEALEDAGYLDGGFDRQRTAVILGRGTYVNRGYATVFQYAIALDQTIRVLARLHPEHTPAELAAIRRELKSALPPFGAETAPGLVPSVMCGRIANRLDLMGPAYAVDAACASSLIAVDLAMAELRNGRADMVLAGGIQVSTTFPITLIFCQLGALSRSGHVRSFHPDADGTLLGEGAGVIVLKRLADAERDGDRIYAVLRSVGTASDGKALGVLAPRREGEELAIRRAYEAAGVSVDTIGLVEAHGTGRPSGMQPRSRP